MTTRKAIDRLLFIYSADAGRWSAFIDSAKKLLMINGCALCSITHGLTSEKQEWKSCRDELGIPVDYLHRDELSTDLRHLVGDSLPAVVAVAGEEYHVLMSAEVLERCRGSVADFRGRLQTCATMKELTLPRSRSAA